jgi:hypothetical protein
LGVTLIVQGLPRTAGSIYAISKSTVPFWGGPLDPPGVQLTSEAEVFRADKPRRHFSSHRCAFALPQPKAGQSQVLAPTVLRSCSFVSM